MTTEEMVVQLVVIREAADGLIKVLAPPVPTAGCPHDTVQDISGAGGLSKKVCVDCKQEVA